MLLKQLTDISNLLGFIISVLGFIITIWTAYKVKSLSKVLLSSKIQKLISKQISTIDDIKNNHNYGDDDGDDTSISTKEKKIINSLLDKCNEIVSHLSSKKEIINLNELQKLKDKIHSTWSETDKVLTDLRKELSVLKNILSGEIMKWRNKNDTF